MLTTDEELAPSDGWCAPPSVRIPVPPKSKRGLLFRTVGALARTFRRPEVPHVFAVMNINRRLFWAWLFFAAQMMPFGRLTNRLRELVILRVAWQCRCRYEWGQHVEIALGAGVSDAEVFEVTRESPLFEDAVTTYTIRACDETLRGGLIGDETWGALSGALSTRELLELMVLVGHYRMLAAVLVNAGVPLEEDIEEVLRAFHGRLAASGPSLASDSAR